MSINAQFQTPEGYFNRPQQLANLIDIRDIPPLPEVTVKVIEYADDGESNAEELSRIISRDQGLTGYILKTANSAFFGLRRQIGTIRHAAVVLGANRLKSAVITAAMGQVYIRTPLGRVLWEHSLVVALIASELAKIHRFYDPEVAFVAGVMHDVGKSIIDAQNPDGYVSVMEKVSREGMGFLEAELQCFGYDHTHVGARVAEVWNLPKPLADTIKNHHHTWTTQSDPELTSIVYLADKVAQSIGIGIVQNYELDLKQVASKIELEIDPNILNAVGEGVRTKFEQNRKFFGLT